MRTSRQLFLETTTALLILTGGAGAQETPRLARVPVDRNSAAIGTVLPFDEPFLLIGAAGTNLLRLDVIYADAQLLSHDSCAAAFSAPHPKAGVKADSHTLRQKLRAAFGFSPPLAPQSATWTRIRTGADSFWVQVSHPLPPNRDYTFCLRSREAPSTDDSASFQTKATGSFRAALRKSFASIGAKSLGDPELADLRAALIAALPSASSVRAVDITPGSIFDASATGPALATTFAALLNDDLYRLDAAKAVESQHDKVAPSLRADIQRLAPRATMVKLSRVEVAQAKLGDSQEKRLQAAVAVAGAIASLNVNNQVDETSAAAIAIGLTPISVPRAPFPRPVFATEFSSAAEVSPLIANLDTTLARLQGLAELVSWVGADPKRARAAGISHEEIKTIGGTVQQLLDDANAQGSNLRQLQDALRSFETHTSQLVTNVALRDLKEVGYYSTTNGRYETRARWLISQDLGVLYAWPTKSQGKASDAAPYLGVNFYLRPVNKRAPMSRWNPLDLRRWSATIGATVGNIQEKDRYSGIVDGKALIAGGGFRLTDFFRVSYGAPLVWTYTPDKARRKRLTALQYAGISIDADLRELLGGVATALFGK